MIAWLWKTSAEESRYLVDECLGGESEGLGVEQGSSKIK